PLVRLAEPPDAVIGSSGRDVSRKGRRMKRAVVLALATVLALCLVGVASAFTPGKPEVDRAAGRFDGQAKPKLTRCVGEDGDPYVQYEGRLARTMSDTRLVPAALSVNGVLT